MKIAVTGASGHIGNCLIHELIQRGYKVKVLVHSLKNNFDGLNVEIIQGDILDKESLNRLCEGVEVVFHLAAQIAIDNQRAKLVYDTNVTGTNNIVNAALNAGIKKFIHFSSIDAFQSTNKFDLLDENQPLVTSKKSIYEFTKAESERIVLEAFKIRGLNALILSPTAVIGPFDYKNSLSGQALRRIYHNKLPFLVEGGYNWVDVRDIVEASIKAIKCGINGEKYILSGNYCNLHELAILVGKISGNKILGVLPLWVARMACPFFQLWSLLFNTTPLFTTQSLTILEHSSINISFEKAKKDLAYSPRSLNETIIDTFEWYKLNNLL